MSFLILLRWLTGFYPRFIDFLANKHEEDRTWSSTCVECLITKCWADVLWLPFKAIVQNPILSLAMLAMLFILYCLIYIPLWFTSFLVTSYGSFAILCFILHLLIQYIAKSLAYPGYTSSFKKNISIDYFGRISSQFLIISQNCTSFIATMMLVLYEKVPKTEIANLKISRGVNEIALSIEALKQSGYLIDHAVDELRATNKASESEIQIIKELQHSVSYLSCLLSDFHKNLVIIFPIDGTTNSTGNSSSKSSAMNKLIRLAGQCITACEHLKKNAVDFGPSQREDEGIFSVMKSVLTFYRGPSGVEKLSLPMMRESMRQKLGFIHHSIIGPDKNLIDSIVIPAFKRRNKSSPNNDKRSHSIDAEFCDNKTDRSRDMVFYCSPNAAMYESFALCPLDHSWIGFYCSMGFDVCMFNYRGYGESSGSPTPDRCRADGLAVLSFMKEMYSLGKIIVHGESIGGLVACHLARQCLSNNDLLVCDRTFASLDAVAHRLLGRVMGHGLRWIGQWHTDVVSDFISAPCLKVVLQDPFDAIVSHTSSLKVGVATKLQLGDSQWTPISMPRQYQIADYLNLSVPLLGRDELEASSVENQMLDELADHEKNLDESFIFHFSACIKYILKFAKIERHSYKEFRSSDNLVSESSDRRDDAVKNRNIVGNVNADDINFNDDHSVTNFYDVESGNESESISLQKTIKPQIVGRTQNLSVDGLRSDHTMMMGPVNKFVASMACIDGGSGQLFGHAMVAGVDNIRAWLCCLLVWAVRSSDDKSMPLETIDVFEGAKCLRSLYESLLMSLQQPQPNRTELNGDFEAKPAALLRSLSFICCSFEGLCRRLLAHVKCSNQASKSCVRSIPAEFAAKFQSLEPNNGAQSHQESIKALRSQFVTDSLGVGLVVPLHEGHNGWPSKYSLEIVKEFIKSSGFDDKC